MKATSLLLLPLLAVFACQAPQSDVPAAGSTPSVSRAVSQSPVVQITEYNLSPDGDKAVTLGGKEIRVNWRLKNNYTYDGQQRLTQQRTTLRNNSSWWEQLSYQYSGSLIEHYQNSDNKDYLNTLLLNEKGHLKGNQAPDEYTYDAQEYLIHYQGNGQQDTYTIKDGNVVARETIFSSGSIQRNTYEYDLSKSSIPYPVTFRGQQSQNLLIRQTLTTTSAAVGASQTTVFTYSYDFDQQGRGVREFVQTNHETSPGSIREFLYQ